MVDYRLMTGNDIEAGLALCRSAKWNQLERDWQFFLEQHPAGCIVAEKDDKVVGTATTINYGDKFSWIGMVLVDPATQRQGIGVSLLKGALEILHQKETVKLDATAAGREVYLKLGFQDEYGLTRMYCSNIQVPADATTARPIQADDLPRIVKFDADAFGAERKLLLEWMYKESPEFAFLIEENGTLAGYCLGRPGFNFNHLGPVVANHVDVAQSLVLAALRNFAGQPVILDVLQHDPSWLDWLKSIGFIEQRNFIRMFRGTNRFPGIPAKQFAILGPEFG